MSRKRSILSVLHEEPTSRPIAKPTTRKRPKVSCFCNRCNGNLVDPRTKRLHELNEQYNRSIQEEYFELPQLRIENENREASEETLNTLEQTQQNQQNIDQITSEEQEEENRKTTDDFTYPEHDFALLLRKRRNTNRQTSPVEPLTIEHEDSMPADEYEDSATENSEFETEDDDEHNDYTETFENYSPPDYEPFKDPTVSKSTNDSRFLWILIWIMNFRVKFNISETATEVLIKFMKIVLKEVIGDNFDGFPDSLYLARKELDLKDRFHSFVVCPKCHKLYQKKEVIDFRQAEVPAIMKCQHVEYPNSARRKTRPCQTPLSHQIKLLDGQITNQPNLIFPFVGIRQQLATLYRRPGFESLLRHWANRSDFDDILTDVYDGQIWKNFKETNNEESLNFFRSEMADSHLGLMLNLDWFQPYENTVYSTGVIYAAICNLPRDLRFKRENLLILGLLPGPNEVSLHRINHYLAPIIDELESLWDGVALDRTFEFQERRYIRAALVLVSCDIPAARKICGHVSVLVSCHRCEKKANFENWQHNYAGMDDMEEWFFARDSAQHRQNAEDWRRCKSNAERERFVKQYGVRWSELLRLPYFDPIRFIIVDPMHCLFLGVAKWIVKRIWIGGGILTPNILKKVQKKMDKFQIPADLGRIPNKIDCGEGFANLTADQWRNFFIIYATASLWEHLPAKDRKILTHFVRVCTILVSRILEFDLMSEAHQRLIEIIKLIENHYGRDKVTPNLHLSLHLCECSYDFGPLYAFWCFSFERMNGMIGSLPNSHRQVEPEIIRRLMNDNRIANLTNSGIETKGLDLLNNRSTVGSLSATDNFSSDEMHRFWLNSRVIQGSVMTGSEQFPGEVLNSTSENMLLSNSMLNLLVKYYTATYESFEFRRPSIRGGLEDDIIIRVKINQFGRCRIGSEIFGSAVSSRHVKSSFVLAKFITDDGGVDCYPGQIQYFFTHTLDLPNGPAEHTLAYIRWYHHASSQNIRYHFGIDDEDNTCNVELWGTDFYPESRDCIIPVHNILERFVPVKYRISNRRNARDYLAINPINRKFQIR